MRTTLNIGFFFIAALQQSEAVKALVGDRLFYTMRTSTAESEDKVPYIIVVTGKAASRSSVKDEWTDELRSGVVSVLCVANDGYELGRLIAAAHNAIVEANKTSAIYDAHPEWDFPHLNITPGASEVEGDPTKPCLMRELFYECRI